MRPTIVLLSPSKDHQVVVGRLRGAGDYTEGEFFDRLDRGECRFGVDVSQDVLEEFEESEREEVRLAIGESFRAVTLEYAGVPCLRDLLAEVLQGASGLLDTNHGELVPYGEVLARFHQDPLWDWRSTPG